MLHKDYDHKGKISKRTSGRGPQEAWHQGEMNGGKPPAVK
jgi:hypothetical protein